MDLINFVTHQNKSFGNYSILCQAEALRPYNLLEVPGTLTHPATNRILKA
jgi:hypothetical protein